MPRHRKPAPKKQRHISVRPVYRDKPDTEALAKALMSWALSKPSPTDREDHASEHPAA